MLESVRNRLDSWAVIVAFGAAYLVSQIAIGVIVHPLGSDMLAVQVTLSADHVRAIFARWDAAGLTGAYAAHYRYDMLHPLWYSVALAAMLSKAFEACRVPRSRNPLLILPFVAGGCDILENLVHQTFLADRANITQGAVWLANGAAITKWILVAWALVTVGVLASRAVRTKRATA